MISAQLDYLQSVHVAGTKGKGSTAAYLSNILRAEGYSVGCYTRYAWDLFNDLAIMLKKLLPIMYWLLLF